MDDRDDDVVGCVSNGGNVDYRDDDVVGCNGDGGYVVDFVGDKGVLVCGGDGGDNDVNCVGDGDIVFGCDAIGDDDDGE